MYQLNKQILFIPIFALLAACAQESSSTSINADPNTGVFPTVQPSICPDQPPVASELVTTVHVKDEFTAFQANRELVRCLPTTWADGYKRAPIFAQHFTGLRKGDTLIVFAEYEVTNDSGVNVMIGSHLLLSSSLGISGALVEVSEANGFNVTPAMHHAAIVKVGELVLTKDYAQVYLVLYGYAATNGLPASSLTVEQDYGRMSGFVVRAESGH